MDVFASLPEEVEAELNTRMLKGTIATNDAALVKVLVERAKEADNDKFGPERPVKLSAHDVLMNAATLVLNGGTLA